MKTPTNLSGIITRTPYPIACTVCGLTIPVNVRAVHFSQVNWEYRSTLEEWYQHVACTKSGILPIETNEQLELFRRTNP